MNKRLVVAILSAVFLILGSVFFAWFHNAENPQKPLASQNGGYYDEAFSLKFFTFPGNTIYYTTDGSTPTLNSQVYAVKFELRIAARRKTFTKAFKTLCATGKPSILIRLPFQKEQSCVRFR